MTRILYTDTRMLVSAASQTASREAWLYATSTLELGPGCTKGGHSLSDWRKIWREAIRANGMLVRDRTTGEAEFERLLTQYDSDPMIFYERGEAYDLPDELDLAESDYRMAEQGLKEPHWQTVASEALNDILYRKHATAVPPSAHILRVRIHALHALPQLPDEVRADAISAVARFDAEPHLSAIELRACAEALAWRLLPSSDRRRLRKAHFGQIIDQLERNSIVPYVTIVRMRKVAELGNKAAHRRSDEDPVDFHAILVAFMDVATWFCGSRWAQT